MEDTHKGGNDYEISIDDKITKSFTVTGPQDTMTQIKKIINEYLS